jgi:hypothetical protein
MSMEAVFSVPELMDLIMPDDFCEEAQMIARFRMVCKWMSELFKTATSAQTKTRYGKMITATVYSVRHFHARGPYRLQADAPDFLQKIDCFDICYGCTPGYADIIHTRWWIDHAGDRVLVTDGYDMDPVEFVTLNKLFGIKSSAYTMLWTRDWSEERGEVKITAAHEDVSLVAEVDGPSGQGLSHHVRRVCSHGGIDAPGGVYYLFYEQVHVCDVDIGSYTNLQRLTRLKW